MLITGPVTSAVYVLLRLSVTVVTALVFEHAPTMTVCPTGTPPVGIVRVTVVPAPTGACESRTRTNGDVPPPPAETVSVPLLTTVPPGVVTVILPVVDALGIVSVMLVDEATV